ncbi:hypothetical protein H632_c1171p0 [Helicosporidium sp. ATCC 50920]|nr:hypothetical protein H632_c1171p0 [Helicosporidium sp. ATCC 50920]|eukprot:KDD74630.1 hypothetical protein H632_c1171p0 [Helicosporidium sp. ATCC 50920]
MTALESLLCPRRVLLTGTPVQNAPREFFALADFASPGSLGSFETFQTVFGRPILQARERHASAAAVELGAARARELQERVSKLLLRRTAETNAAFLPELSTYVVFCRPAQAQLARYRDILKAYHASRGGADGDALAVIQRLRQLCSHPCLERLEEAEEGRKLDQIGDPDTLSRDSGKFAALRVMLGVWAAAKERCVIVSQSTATLDVVAGLCAALSLRCARLDGGTEVSKRQDVVEAFNSHGVGHVFLLSTAAGGAGLNLTGASRLVLFDSHWMLLTGTIEEKTYQRQLRKSEVASELGMRGKDAREDAQLRKFSEQDLKRLFELREHTDCDTYDVLQAVRSEGGGGMVDGVDE